MKFEFTSFNESRKNVGGNGLNIGGFHFRLTIAELVDKSHATVAELCRSGNCDIFTLGDAPVTLAFIARIGSMRSSVVVSAAFVDNLDDDKLLPL